MTAAAIFEILVAILDAQTRLVTAITASQPADVSAELWRRFADDTLWIHVALAKLNAHLVSALGPLPADPPPTPPAK